MSTKNRRRRGGVDKAERRRKIAAVTPRKPTGPKPKYPPQQLGPRDQAIGVRRGNLHEPLLERERAGLKPVEIIRRDLLRFYAAADDSVKRCGLTVAELERVGAITSELQLDDPKTASLLWALVVAEVGAEHPLPAKLKGQPLAVLYGVIDAAERAYHRREGNDG